MHFFTRKTIAFLLLLFVFAGSFLVPTVTLAEVPTSVGNEYLAVPASQAVKDYVAALRTSGSAIAKQTESLALAAGEKPEVATNAGLQVTYQYDLLAKRYQELYSKYDENGKPINGYQASLDWAQGRWFGFLRSSTYDDANKAEYKALYGAYQQELAQTTALTALNTSRYGGDKAKAQALMQQAIGQNTSGNASIKEATDAMGGGAEPIICIKFTGPLPTGIDFIGCGALAAWTMLKVSSYILALVAMLFNVCIDYTLNFKNFVTQYDIVGLGWKSFRDLINLTFIFVLVYIGIGTIIGSGSFNKKTLPQIILAAVFINFSLFFTQVMIDGSNIITLQFYNKIIENSKEAVSTQNNAKSTGVVGKIDSSIAEYDSGMSAALVKALGMEDIFTLGVRSSSGEDSRQNFTGALNAMKLLLYGLLGSIFTLVTAFVLGAAAFMFIFRAVTLLFLMILSPAGFLFGFLPKMEEYSKMWWSTLTKNLIFAPIYMALMYVVLSMILQGSRNHGSFLKMFEGGKDAPQVIFVFVVLISLMSGCLYIATKLGAEGASTAASLGKKWAGAARGYATGLAMKPVNFTTRTGVVAAGAVAGGAGALLAKNGGVIGARIGSRLMGLKDTTRNVKIGGKSQEEIIKSQVTSIKKRAEYVAKAHEASSSATPAEKAAAKAKGETAVDNFITVGALGSAGQGLGMGITTKREALKKVAEERKKKAEGKTKGAQDALEKLELYSDAEKSSASTNAEKFKKEMAGLKTKLGEMEEAEAQGTAIDQNEYKFLMERLDNKRKEHKAVMEIIALQKKVEKEKNGLFDKEDEKKS